MSEETRPTGHITCSSLNRIWLCPGSWNLEQKVPAQEEDVGLEAQSGIRIHAVLAGEIPAEVLTAEERETYDACRELTQQLIPGTHKGNYIAEQRLYLRDGDRTLLSGRFDAAWTGQYRILIVDYKSGRGDLPPAERDWQLRALAVLWWTNHLEDHGKPIEVAKIQPHGTPQVTRCLYTPEDLQKSHGLLLQMLAVAYDPNAVRRPSEEACKYCRAKAICPEATGTVTGLAVIDRSVKLDLVPAVQLARLLDACKIAEQVIEDVHAEAKRRIKAGEKFGWHLKPGQERETITNLSELYYRCVLLGVTQEEFVAACGMTKKAFRDLARRLTGQKGMALDLTVKQTLEGCVDVKVTEPSLERDRENDQHSADKL